MHNLPDVLGFATRDLFVPHPTQPGLWRPVGRSDDVLVLHNGLKVVPTPMEALISSHPDVDGAVMFGRERDQVGLLVQPANEKSYIHGDHESLRKLRDEIWYAPTPLICYVISHL